MSRILVLAIALLGSMAVGCSIGYDSLGGYEYCPEVQANDCISCMAAECGQELSACQADDSEECQCALNCVINGAPMDLCQEENGNPSVFPGSCLTDVCANECGLMEEMTTGGGTGETG